MKIVLIPVKHIKTTTITQKKTAVLCGIIFPELSTVLKELKQVFLVIKKSNLYKYFNLTFESVTDQ